MSNNHAQHDQEAPRHRGARLTQLQAGLIAASKKRDQPRFASIEPIARMALIGAQCDPQTNRLTFRDDIVVRAFMREILPYVPVTDDFTIDLYESFDDLEKLAERKPYDIALLYDVHTYDDLGASHELLKNKQQPRFIATWGVEDHIEGADFAEASHYDLRQSPGRRLLSRLSFSLAQKEWYEVDLLQPFSPAAKEAVFSGWPGAELAVRNDVLEAIAANHAEAAKDSVLFGAGVERVQKMALLAEVRQARAKPPVASSDDADYRDLEDLRALAGRPLNAPERLARRLRMAFA